MPIFRVVISSLCVLLVSASLLARQQPDSTGGGAVTANVPGIVAVASAGKVRFISPGATAEMRVQIIAEIGEVLYDSQWKDGNVLDWAEVDSQGQPLAVGTYRCVIEVQDLRGRVTGSVVSLSSDGQHVSVEPVANGGASLRVSGPGEAGPRITLLAHDGKDGEIVSTVGDLSFRFGDFLNGSDVERMRLTADGDLNVDGLIRANKGIMFPDGTILTTAAGFVASGPGDGSSMMRQRPSAPSSANAQSRAADVRQRVLLLNPPAVSAPPLTPRRNVGPANQFVVDSAGVHIGTTSAFGLDVAGNVTLSSNLSLPFTSSSSVGVIMVGGVPFVHDFGSSNTFLGAYAGNFNMPGGGNTAMGTYALYNNYTGTNLLAVGQSALYANTTGSSNTATGALALQSNTIGSGNTANGTRALYNNIGTSTTGNRNTASGVDALYANSTGNSNVAIGAGALYYNTAGSGNIAIGDNAGVNLTTGANNIDIASGGVSGEGGTIRIGSGAHTRTFIAGINGGSIGSPNSVVYVDANGQLGTTSSSRRYKFDISDMGEATDGLIRLRPVTFRYLAQGENAPLQYGLIAEEVAEVYPELVTRNKDGEVESVMYQFLAPMLLNEVQKQHRAIEDQRNTIERQANDIDTLSKTLATVEERLEALEKRAAQN